MSTLETHFNLELVRSVVIISWENFRLFKFFYESALFILSESGWKVLATPGLGQAVSRMRPVQVLCIVFELNWFSSKRGRTIAIRRQLIKLIIILFIQFCKWNQHPSLSVTEAHRALELLEDYHSKLIKPQDKQLRLAIERVIRIFKSRLFQALLGKCNINPLLSSRGKLLRNVCVIELQFDVHNSK